jgi:hypothetical protein
VSISSRARLWSSDGLVSIYIHECAHRFLQGHGHEGHDTAFAALLMALLMRTDAAGLTDDAVSWSMDLYCLAYLPVELADTADSGLGRCMSWALLTARELTVTELDAEDMADQIVQRLGKWLAELATEPRRLALQVQQVARQKEVVASLREQVWTLKLVCFGLGLLVVALFYSGLK